MHAGHEARLTSISCAVTTVAALYELAVRGYSWFALAGPAGHLKTIINSIS